MSEDGQRAVGERVAALRKLRGLTQAELAACLNRSVSWVTKIERGDRRLDSMAVLSELARALGVPVAHLIGDHASRAAGQPETGTLADLRRVLDRPATVEPSTEPSPVAELVLKAIALRRVYDTARNNFSAMRARLPSMLSQTQSAVRAAPEAVQPDGWAALVGLYRLAAMEFSRSGDSARARVAVDRALAAAERSDDPVLVGAVGVFTAQVTWHHDPESALTIVDGFIDLLSRHPRARTATGAAMLGALHSQAAVAAARAGHRYETRARLAAAGRAAEVLGRDSAPHGVYFGPTYHGAAATLALVELGHPREAARVGERIPLGRLASVTRGGFHAAYLAKAHCMCSRHDEAIAMLLDGLRVAPELLRTLAGGITRAVVGEVLDRRRRMSDDLRRIVRALNVVD